MQREVQSVQRMLDRAGANALRTIHQTFYQITAQVAKERSLQLIVRRSSLLYADPRLDISAEVLKRLNTNLPSVTVILPKNRRDNRSKAPVKK